MLDEIEISSPQPFDPGQAVSKQVWGQWNKSSLQTHSEISKTLYDRQYVFFYIIHSKVDVVMKYHESVLEDFSGVLMIDSHSNAFLNLTLINTMGSVHGTISTINYTQVSNKVLKTSVIKNLSESLKMILRIFFEYYFHIISIFYYFRLCKYQLVINSIPIILKVLKLLV